MKVARRVLVVVALAAVFLVAVIVMFTSMGRVYASGSGTVTVDEPQLLSYKINPLSGEITRSGQIIKGDTFDLELHILDSRVKSTSPGPSATLNTASFTGPRQGNINVLNATSPNFTYTVTFKGLSYTGSGNTFSCDLSYTNDTSPMAPLNLVLNQCVEYVAPEVVVPDQPEVIVKGTGFILKEASYGSEPIYAGQTFTLSAVLLATNGAASVENVAVTFTPPEQLTFAQGSSVVYIGTMAPNASVPINAAFMPGANIEEGSYTISLDVNGVNQNTGEAVSAQMTVTIPVLQPERFEIFKTQLPTDLTAGMDEGAGYGSITLVNKGKGAVANVSVEIIGTGLRTDEGKQFIGNVGAGEQKTAEFNILADSPGQVDALVVVSYENTRGDQKTLEQAFTVNIADYVAPEIVDPDLVPPEEEDGSAGLPGWLWVIIVAAVAAAVTIILLRRRKKKLAAAEAALDYTSDDDDELDDSGSPDETGNGAKGEDETQ